MFMRKSTKGFYTVEAALILPILIIGMLTLGYYIKVQGIWENVFNGAIDETLVCAAKGYDDISNMTVTSKVKKRIEEENEGLVELDVDRSIAALFAYDEGVVAYRIKAKTSLDMPLDFGHQFTLETAIKYRSFVGRKPTAGGMGREALETGSIKNPVVIFPQEGEKYHGEECTYVKATVTKQVLTNQLKESYSSCGLCNSIDIADGQIVYCFKSEGGAYHKNDCKSIARYTITVDRDEAIEKGYTPCSKCGGN